MSLVLEGDVSSSANTARKIAAITKCPNKATGQDRLHEDCVNVSGCLAAARPVEFFIFMNTFIEFGPLEDNVGNQLSIFQRFQSWLAGLLI